MTQSSYFTNTTCGVLIDSVEFTLRCLPCLVGAVSSEPLGRYQIFGSRPQTHTSLSFLVAGYPFPYFTPGGRSDTDRHSSVGLGTCTWSYLRYICSNVARRALWLLQVAALVASGAFTGASCQVLARQCLSEHRGLEIWWLALATPFVRARRDITGGDNPTTPQDGQTWGSRWSNKRAGTWSCSFLESKIHSTFGATDRCAEYHKPIY